MVDKGIAYILKKKIILSPIDLIKIAYVKKQLENEYENNPDIYYLKMMELEEWEFRRRLEIYKSKIYSLWNHFGNGEDFDTFALEMLEKELEEERIALR